MDVRTCIPYVYFILACSRSVTTSTVSQTVTQPTITAGTSGTDQLNALFAKTAVLEARLNEEITKREALEKEVQSKNDLTEFLKRDVETMNRTLSMETVRRNELGTKLTQLESVVKNLQATLDEDRGLVPKLSHDLHALDTRLTNQINAMNWTIYNLMTSSNLNSAKIQNLSSQLSESIVMALNQTKESIDTSIKLLNASVTFEVANISSLISSLTSKLTISEREINTLNSSLARQELTISGFNATMNAYLHSFETDIAILNKTTINTSKECASTNNALNASIGLVITELGSFKSSESVKIAQLVQDITSVETKVDHYAVLTGEFNKTLNTLTTTGGQGGQTGETAVFFFARKPTFLTLGNNRPPSFTTVSASARSTFDPSKSLFTCSSPGVYLFSVTIQKDETEGNPRIQCWLKRNGELLVSIDAHSAFVGSSPSASSTAVIPLSKGDVVQLTQCTVNTYLEATTTSFSGVLLQPL